MRTHHSTRPSSQYGTNCRRLANLHYTCPIKGVQWTGYVIINLTTQTLVFLELTTAGLHQRSSRPAQRSSRSKESVARADSRGEWCARRPLRAQLKYSRLALPHCTAPYMNNAHTDETYLKKCIQLGVLRCSHHITLW